MKVPPDATVYEGTVPFHDCDPLGIVWHGHYYKYLELGRTELFKRYRLDMRDFIDLGYRLVMIETRCRHAFPLRYDERFRVHAWLQDVEQRLRIAYQIDNVTRERRAARAWTTLVVTTRDDEMLMETPDEILARIRS